MKLPFIILRRTRAEMIDAQTNNMRKMLATDLEHLQLALNVIECLSETLEQYEQAMEEMTESRNDMDFQAGIWFNKANEWRTRYELLASEASTPARTREEDEPCSNIQ